MKPPTCITGGAFSPADGAILWTHAVARGCTGSVWVPQDLVERLRLRGHMTAAPAGISAENGRRLFYNLAQLGCPREEVETGVARLMSAAYGSPALRVACDDVRPLDTNGEPFPASFALEVLARFGHGGTQSILGHCGGGRACV